MDSTYAITLESYLIPAEEALIKPSKELEEYKAKSVEERIQIWIDYLKTQKIEVIKKLPSNVKLFKFFNTICKKTKIGDYEMILYTTKKDPDYKNPSKMKLYIKTKFLRRPLMVSYDISIDPKTAEKMYAAYQNNLVMQQVMQQNQQILQQQMIDQQNIINQQNLIDQQNNELINQINLQNMQMQTQIATNFGMGF